MELESASTLEIAAREELQEFVRKLNAYKKENRLTWDDLSFDCELSINTLILIFNGKSVPTAMNYIKIKLALGI